MDAKIINIAFWFGILLIASSFLIKSHTLSIILAGAIIVISAFLLEALDARKHHDIHISKVVNIHRLTLILVLMATLIYFIMIQKNQILRPDNSPSFYIVFLLNFALIIVLLVVCFKTLSKRDKIIPLNPDNATRREQLVAFIKGALARGERRDDLRKEALAQGWPKDIVDEELKATLKGKESPATIALKDYKYQILKKYVKRALASKFSQSQVRSSSIKSGWPEDLVDRAIEESAKELQGASSLELQDNVEDLPQEIFRMKDYETDFDKLYSYVKEKGIIKLKDVAKMFNLTDRQAEEWAQILSHEGLLKLHYPPFGDPELQWNKSKDTQ